MFEVLTEAEAGILWRQLGRAYDRSRMLCRNLNSGRLERNSVDRWRKGAAEVYAQAAMRQELTLLRTQISREAL